MSHTYRRLALVTALATLVVALTAGAAFASRGLELRPRTGNPRQLASGRLTLATAKGEIVISCSINLLVTLNRTVAKSARAAVASFVSVQFAGCRPSEEASLFREVRTPWTLGYQSFTGTLPNITELVSTLSGFAFLYELRPLLQMRLRWNAHTQNQRQPDKRREAVFSDVAELPIVDASLTVIPCGALFGETFSLKGDVRSFQLPIEVRLI